MNIGCENEYQEFKESLSQLDKGIKSLTAMLNRNGHGTVYFGVNDKGDVIGLQIGSKTLMDIRNRIRDLIEPQLFVNIEECRDEEKHYIKVSASAYDIPYSCDGRYYIRNVSADESISNEMLRKMLVYSDADVIRQISSENQKLTFTQMLQFLTSRGIHAKDNLLFLSNYGLLNKEQEYNLMAYLMSDQNNMSIKVVKFDGIDKSVISERTEFGKQCLLKSIQMVLDYFKTKNITHIDVKQGSRKEISLFDYESFREAWINACLHNHWNEYIPPSIYLFDDRIEIDSYGGLPYGLSQEGFYMGTSMPVNKGLLSIFISSGFAEQSGHGVPIIVSSYGKEAFSFDNEMIRVKLTFRFEPEYVTVRKMKEKMQLTLTDNQQKVFEYLANNPRSNLQNVADDLALSIGGVKKIVAKLQEEELIHREGTRRAGIWIIDFKKNIDD